MGNTGKMIGIGTCTIAVTVIFICSAGMNAHFLSGWGQTGTIIWRGYTITALMYGAFGVGFDVLKAGLPFFVTQRSWYWKALIWIGWACLVCISLTSAIGFQIETRGNVITRRGIEAGTMRSLQAQLDTDRKRLKDIGVYRDPSVIQAEIHRLLATPIRGRDSLAKRTEDCTGSRAPAYRACRNVAKLRVELAASRSAERLRRQISAAEKKLGWLPIVPGVDAQAAAFSQITGKTENSIRIAIIIAVAITIEFFSSLGFWIIYGGRRRQARVPPSSQDSRLSFASSEYGPVEGVKLVETKSITFDDGHIASFADAHLVPDVGSRLAGSEILQAYNNWCAQRGIRPLRSNLVMPALRQRLCVEARKSSKGRMIYPLALRNADSLSL